MTTYRHLWCIAFSIFLLLSGLFQNGEVNVAIYQKSSSSMVAHALFLNEPFIYRGKAQTMATNFTITLSRVATIPMKLRFNSMCQVLDAQLDEFNKENTNTSAKVLRFEKRAVMDTGTCAVGSGCTGLGMGSFCVGTQANFIGKDCINALWNTAQEETRKVSEQVMKDSMDYTNKAIDIGISGAQNLIHTALDGFNTQLSSAITQQEATIGSAILTSAAEVTNAVNTNIDNLRQSINDNFSNLQNDANRRFAIEANTINTIGTTLSSISTSLEKSIIKNTINTNVKVANLSTYLNSLVDMLNANSLGVQSNFLSIMRSIQTLVVKAHRQNTFSYQGEDISSLLALWKSQDKTYVFMDNNTTNTYKYVSPGMVGLYPQDMIDVAYPFENDVNNRYAFRCWEKGAPPQPLLTTGKFLYVTVSLISSCASGDTVYGLLLSLIKTNCGSTADQLLATVDYLLTTSYLSFFTLVEDEFGYLVEVESPSFSSNPKTFRVQPTSRGPCSAPQSLSFVVNSTLNAIINSNASQSFSNTDKFIVLLATQATSPLSSVTPDQINFSYRLTTTRDLLSDITISCGMTRRANLEYTIASIPTTLYGNGHFIVKHPQLNFLNIHSCSLINDTAFNIITDWNHPNAAQDGFAVTAKNGKVLEGGYLLVNPGKQAIPAYGGNVGDSVDMMVRQTDTDGNNILGMEPDPFYYSSDMWCCDNYTNIPVITVDAVSNCGALGYQLCDSAVFGNCSLSGTIQVRKLVRIATTLPWICPTGYSNPPISNLTMYKSPRMYYCSDMRKYREPYGIELAFCDKGEIELPGAGVLVETGIMAPGGLYPASCIFYNSVYGQVPLYKISTSFNRQVVPSLLNDLNGKMVAYFFDVNITVDEMDRLYGEENNGYDCVRYEMDRKFHVPQHCINFDIPTYETPAYFSGRIRSSGLSRLLDYFEITPRYVAGSQDLILTFTLKASVDYDAAYIDNQQYCPTLQVTYVTSPSACLLSGWEIVGDNITPVKVAGKLVCDGKGSCVSSLRVQDQTDLAVSIITPDGEIPCSQFKCLASSNLFVAYPVDLFQVSLQRPDKDLFIPTAPGINYTASLNEILASLTASTAQAHNMILTPLGSDVNTTVSFQFTQPDLNGILDALHNSTKDILSDIDYSVNKTKNDVTGYLDESRNQLHDNYEKAYQDSVNAMGDIFAEYAKVGVEYHNTDPAGLIDYLNNVVAQSAKFRILVIVGLALSVMNFIILLPYTIDIFFLKLRRCCTRQQPPDDMPLWGGRRYPASR